MRELIPIVRLDSWPAPDPYHNTDDLQKSFGPTKEIKVLSDMLLCIHSKSSRRLRAKNDGSRRGIVGSVTSWDRVE
jgi:hypothetical protein